MDSSHESLIKNDAAMTACHSESFGYLHLPHGDVALEAWPVSIREGPAEVTLPPRQWPEPASRSIGPLPGGSKFFKVCRVHIVGTVHRQPSMAPLPMEFRGTGVADDNIAADGIALAPPPALHRALSQPALYAHPALGRRLD